MTSPCGRYAPSPSGRLHIGNLRTALIAWALATNSGRNFAIRVEDIDRVKAGAAEGQLEDLAALGITWHEPVLFQSTRHTAHVEALHALTAAGRTYECYCSRKDIQAAPRAPHTPPGAYPGTCRNLTEAERTAARERLAAAGRKPSIRLRADVDTFTVREQIAGFSDDAARTLSADSRTPAESRTRADSRTPPKSRTRADSRTPADHTLFTGAVDDFVLRRGDGVLAYNLVAVVDDAYQGVDQVCRADDLLTSAPRQAYLAHLLGLPEPTYAHVPLVVNAEGARLAKRDGAVTLPQLRALGWSIADVVAWCARSLGLPVVYTAADFASECTLAALRQAGGPHVFAAAAPTE